MKIILGNDELKEIVQHWAGQKFNQSAEVSIANKKNGIEVTVDMNGALNTAPFKNVSPELVATGCCGAEICESNKSRDEENESTEDQN